MNNDIKFNEVILKYKFKDSIPADVQSRLTGFKRKDLYIILKEESHFAVVTALAVFLYFQFKNLGITVAISKLIIAAGAVIVITAAAMTTGAVIVLKPSIKAFFAAETPVLPPADIKTDSPTGTENIVRNNAIPDTHTALEVIPFKFDAASQLFSMEISNKIISNINSLKGTSYAKVYVRSNAKIDQPKRLIGSVIQTEGIYLLTVKIIDSEAKVLFYKNETIKNTGDINDKVSALAREIAGNIEQK